MFLRPIHGLIFLFKWVQDDEPSGNVIEESSSSKIFFAKQVILIIRCDIYKTYKSVNKDFFPSQVINNACATQAILSVLLNCEHNDISLGPNLEEFKNFCQSFHANMRGLALSNFSVIREAHNSFSRYLSHSMPAHMLTTTCINYLHPAKQTSFVTDTHFSNTTRDKHLKTTMYFTSSVMYRLTVDYTS